MGWGFKNFLGKKKIPQPRDKIVGQNPHLETPCNIKILPQGQTSRSNYSRGQLKAHPHSCLTLIGPYNSGHVGEDGVGVSENRSGVAALVIFFCLVFSVAQQLQLFQSLFHCLLFRVRVASQSHTLRKLLHHPKTAQKNTSLLFASKQIW